MLFIGLAVHQKFIIQCQYRIRATAATNQEADRLQSDLKNLEQLAAEYAVLVKQLPVLVGEYKFLQRRIRVNARKMNSRPK